MSKPDTPSVDPLPTHSHVMRALYNLDDYDAENGIPATDVVERVVDRTGLSSADVRDAIEHQHLNGEIYEPRPDHLRRTEQNDERWERFGTACHWQAALVEARMSVGRGLRPRELAERYDVEDSDRIGELVTRGTLEVENSANEKLTLDDLDVAADRMGISRIVTDGGWELYDPDAPPLKTFDPWKLSQPDDGIVYLYQESADKHWRVINDEDFALEGATGYPVGELREYEAMGDYEDSEWGELRAIYVPPGESADSPDTLRPSELPREETQETYGTLNPSLGLMNSDELKEELDRIVESSEADGGRIVGTTGQDYVKVELLFSPHNAGIELGAFDGDCDE